MIPPPYSEIPVAQPVMLSAQGFQQAGEAGVNPNTGQAYIVNQAPQLGNVNGCTQMIYACSPTPVVYDKYKGRQSKFNGLAQIIVGILCIAFNGAAIGVMRRYYVDTSVVGHGIWAGVFFIITGSFGIAAGAKKSRGFIITFMVLCIIASAGAAVILSLSSLNIAITSSECDYGYYGYYYGSSNYKSCPVLHDARLAINSILLILSVIEGVLVLWGSINCCKVACCGERPQTAYTIQPQPVMFSSMNANSQIVILAAPNSPLQNGSNLGFSVASAPPCQPLQFATSDVNSNVATWPAEKYGAVPQ